MCAPWAFSLVFGSQWHTSGLVAQALAISLAAQLVASTLSQTLIVFEKVGIQFTWDVVRLTSTSGGVIGCHLAGGSFIEAVWTYSLISAANYLWSWDLSRRTIRNAVEA